MKTALFMSAKNVILRLRIISNCCPQQIAAMFSHGMYKHDVLTNYFDEIMESTEFTRWYFGHYHDDRLIMGKFVMLYDSFERVV